ncbi:LysR substrate-binding domain-containing protein [Bradyrhizobium sp. sBnM-33]|uniref:LysR substrate-binding domain-containing protein n=1 Tax=Bradyrhizobium sp. sBnM-33 TaxID=2831780 RepID=UPI00289A23C7|nr:LysR substrate-binding domain-containing protein [Bradyrhizobium sp. sBnM-33]
MDEEMVFACRKDAPIKPSAKLRFGHLAEFDLVMPSRRHGLRMILEEHAAAAGIELKPRLELDTLPALCDVIATTQPSDRVADDCVAAVAGRWQSEGASLCEPRIVRSIASVHHSRRMVSAAARAALHTIGHEWSRPRHLRAVTCSLVREWLRGVGTYRAASRDRCIPDAPVKAMGRIIGNYLLR